MAPVYKFSNAGFLGRTYKSVLAENNVFSPAPDTSYDLLTTELLSASRATITFSNLNATYGADYKHLQVRATARTDRSGAHNEPIQIFVNSDSDANYAYHQLYSYGTGIGSSGLGSQSKMIISEGATSASSATYAFGTSVIDILDPFKTTKYKTFKSLNGYREINYGLVSLYSGMWLNNAAIDSLTFDPLIGANFLAGTRISLYGLRGV